MPHQTRKPAIKLTVDKTVFNKIISLLDFNKNNLIDEASREKATKLFLLKSNKLIILLNTVLSTVNLIAGFLDWCGIISPPLFLYRLNKTDEYF